MFVFFKHRKFLKFGSFPAGQRWYLECLQHGEVLITSLRFCLIDF